MWIVFPYDYILYIVGTCVFDQQEKYPYLPLVLNHQKYILPCINVLLKYFTWFTEVLYLSNKTYHKYGAHLNLEILVLFSWELTILKRDGLTGG